MSEKPLPKEGILIIGTGTLARWAAQIAEASGMLVYGFTPTRQHPQKEQEDISILPPITQARIYGLIRRGKAGYILGLTDPVMRERMAHQLFEKTEHVAYSCIHPNVFISPHAEIGGGAIIFPYVVIAFRAKVGGYVVLESHSSVGAGALIEDFVNIGSGCHIGEECRISSYVRIGRGSVLYAGVKVGKGAEILPGSVVREDVRPGEVYSS
ncbi:MAG: hypothetical protein NZ580_03550 [Bacteroidia bacterium]|nr:hypothetical protein [Bacteroidia bacterium]MDW8235123.1 hypothetical protein [Bacteroidia bacterium]